MLFSFRRRRRRRRHEPFLRLILPFRSGRRSGGAAGDLSGLFPQQFPHLRNYWARNGEAAVARSRWDGAAASEDYFAILTILKTAILLLLLLPPSLKPHFPFFRGKYSKVGFSGTNGGAVSIMAVFKFSPPPELRSGVLEFFSLSPRARSTHQIHHKIGEERSGGGEEAAFA